MADLPTTFEDLGKLRPDLADFHWASCVVDSVYLDPDAEGGPRWTAIVLHLPNYESSLYLESRCHPNCIRACDKPYAWVDEDHKCCTGCIEDSAHRYRTVHE